MTLVDAGLPEPELQMQIVLPDGSIAEADLGYREQRLGIELDGRRAHELPEALYRDRWRQNAVALSDLLLLRFTWWDVIRDGPRFVEQVRSALRRTA